MREFASGIQDAKRPDYFGRDHKSRLQERLQGLGRPLPSYRVSGEVGPDHRKMFHIEVFVGDEMIAQGTGRTKKEAEQEAAMRGLEAITIKAAE
jgi:ribonuclease-3